MRKFKVVNKIFARSSNETYKILSRYTLSLFSFILFLGCYHLFKEEYESILNLIKTILITSVISIFVQYLINFSRRKKEIMVIFKEDNVLATALIISLFTYKEKIIIIVMATLITGIVRMLNKNINISSSLYGILFLLIYQQFYSHIDTPLVNLSNMMYYGTYHEVVTLYGGLRGFLFGTNLYYLSPILCLLSFIYLFYKKSIKYPLVVSYISTFAIGMFIYGLFKGMNIWFVFFQITTGNILFLSIYALTDYKTTPVTQEGQTIYGLLLGTLTIILRFIVPELSVVIPLILGPILLTKYLDNISYKLKYNSKFYQLLSISCIFIAVISVAIIYMIY